MDAKLLTILACDAFLTEVDVGYGGIDAAVTDLIINRILKSYGLTDGKTREEVEQLLENLCADITAMRNDLIKEVTGLDAN